MDSTIKKDALIAILREDRTKHRGGGAVRHGRLAVEA